MLHSVLVPQLGESVREARVVACLKQAGERVQRDEPLVEIETDKATYVVESPESGTVERWHAGLGDVLPVGRELVAIRLHRKEGRERIDNGKLSPRVRAWVEERGLAESVVGEVMREVRGRPITIADFEGRGADLLNGRDYQLSARQGALASRLEAAKQTVASAWISMEADWDALQQTRLEYRKQAHVPPSASTLLAWYTVGAMRAHATFRSAMIEGAGRTVREYTQAVIGLAVALPDDELSVAPVPQQDAFAEFAAAAERALAGKPDKAGEPQVLLSYMAHLGVRSAAPLVTPPAIATLFAGAPYKIPVQGEAGGVAWARRFQLVVAFDHRLINGAGAAKFLRLVTDRIGSGGFE
jgi:pyruvate/2-oxoglutarate dehydrogenase complex dihydrolipoamide acyltransferase (E2) component